MFVQLCLFCVRLFICAIIILRVLGSTWKMSQETLWFLDSTIAMVELWSSADVYSAEQYHFHDATVSTPAQLRAYFSKAIGKRLDLCSFATGSGIETFCVFGDT